MCGRFNVIDSPEVRELLQILGISLAADFRYSRDNAPGAIISIVHELHGHRVVSDATWWLLLEPDTLKPNHRYASFNSRWDKLNTPRSISYRPYRESRCVIPASAFIEGLGDRKTYHKLNHPYQAIAFGGLYKEWVNPTSGELIYSASIITLPPPNCDMWIKQIHPKSMPLMLPQDKATLDAWLNPGNTNVQVFSHLLAPRIRQHLVATPIGKVSEWNPVGGGRVLQPS